jgi:ribonuclease P protein component
MSLSKIVSLKNNEFKEVYNHRVSRADKLLIMYVKRNNLESNRLGISVSKKIGNSIVRHRFCRLVRESYRQNEDKLKQGYDIVVLARPRVVGVKCQEVERCFLHLCSMHHILKEDWYVKKIFYQFDSVL